MDEMFFKKLEEDERIKQEAEDLTKQFDNETGGYSDVDLKYARQQKEIQLKDDFDDDEMD